MKVYSALAVALGLFMWLIICMTIAQWFAGVLADYMRGVSWRF